MLEAFLHHSVLSNPTKILQGCIMVFCVLAIYVKNHVFKMIFHNTVEALETSFYV